MENILKNETVDYIDPNIGGIGHLLTSTMPIVSLPHGMLQASPVFTPSVYDRYLADKIYGFYFSGFSIMPVTGKYNCKHITDSYSSRFDHDLESASPYYYSVLLEDSDIQMEYTVSHRAFYSRIGFPENIDSNIIIELGDEGGIESIDSKSVRCSTKFNGINAYLYMEFSKSYDSYKILTEGNNLVTTGRYEGNNMAAIFKYVTNKDDYLEMKIGISYISIEQAYKNLKNEIKGWDFEQTKNSARNVWNNALNKIQIKGGSAKQRTIFYTAIYRSLLRTCNIAEDDKYFSGYDGKIHETGGYDFYVGDGTWDTYRSQHPLQLLIEPELQNDIVCSYIRMYEQSGWLPRFPYPEGDRPVMLGNHAAAFVMDAYSKGFRDFDLKKAFAGMKKTSKEMTKLPWRNGPATELDRVYMEKGFFPALAKNQKEWVHEVHPFEKRQAVSVTLEHAYDDWCIAQAAKALNNEEDYNYFMKHAYNYRNVYDEKTGFMSPRTAEGSWVEDFDPKFGGGQGGRDYFAECNSWIYTFHVQHDVQGLINLIGGRKKFEERLDSLYIEQYDGPKYDFLKQFPDATGLMGQYCHGNEPAFHIPYLYNYAGVPWKSQRKVREIMELWYNDGPLGICGDEDGGAMSSWYVFSAIGFYPVCPGRPLYDIGSPIFDEVKIDVGNNKVFTIKAENNSPKNKYIQSALLNGEPIDKPWFLHSDISGGGILTLYMGDRPNKAWGSKQEAAPPSMSAII